MAAFEAVVALWSAQQSLAGWCVGTINIRSKKRSSEALAPVVKFIMATKKG